MSVTIFKEIGCGLLSLPGIYLRLITFKVLASLRDPLPGWVDNLNGPMAMFAAGCKGILRAWPHGNAVMDTVPVDVATKIILLASWLKGIGKPLR